MAEDPSIFDRRAVRAHRDRAAQKLAEGTEAEFLHREIGERLLERLDDVKRSFPAVLDLGCRDGVLARALARRHGVERVFQADVSPAFARLARISNRFFPTVVADEEALPFAPSSFDLVISNLALHWVNDLPGAFIQIRRALKPDGLMLAALFGGQTLNELRLALIEAESELSGGAAMRVAPFADLQDIAGLLQRAGFALPAADRDVVTVRYGEPMKLLADLRAMGETSALRERSPRGLSRRILARAVSRSRSARESFVSN